MVLALLWSLFCVLHSLLAALNIKQWFSARMGARFKHYRLLYTLLAFITLGVVVYYQVMLDSPFVFTPILYTKIGGALIAVAGVLIMGVCIKKYFLSLSGLKSLYHEHATSELMLNGIHQFVRHPLYTGTFMAIWGAFIFYPLYSLLIANFILTVYTLIGIELEERKLEKEFGAAYTTYKQKVPKLFPSFRTKFREQLSSPK